MDPTFPAPPQADRLRLLVDESGDPATNPRSSRWLIFGAVALLPGDDSVREAISETRARLNAGGTLHFANMRTPAQKMSAYMALTEAKFTSLVVASDAHAWLPGSGPAEHPSTHYRYVLSHLIQRATVLASSLGLELELILEESEHSSIESIHSYVERLLALPADHPRWRFGDRGTLSRASIGMAPKRQEALLSAADGIAHAYYKALAVDPRFGTAEPHYADIVQPHLWSYGTPARIAGRGFTCLPPGNERRVYRDYPYVREWVIGQKQIAPLLWLPGAHGTAS